MWLGGHLVGLAGHWPEPCRGSWRTLPVPASWRVGGQQRLFREKCSVSLLPVSQQPPAGSHQHPSEWAREARLSCGRFSGRGRSSSRVWAGLRDSDSLPQGRLEWTLPGHAPLGTSEPQSYFRSSASPGVSQAPSASHLSAGALLPHPAPGRTLVSSSPTALCAPEKKNGFALWKRCVGSRPPPAEPPDSPPRPVCASQGYS